MLHPSPMRLLPIPEPFDAGAGSHAPQTGLASFEPLDALLQFCDQGPVFRLQGEQAAEHLGCLLSKPGQAGECIDVDGVVFEHRRADLKFDALKILLKHHYAPPC